MKHVTVGIRVDGEFLAALNSEIVLGRLSAKTKLNPSDQLAVLILAEANGAAEDVVDGLVREEHKSHVETVYELRMVEHD